MKNFGKLLAGVFAMLATGCASGKFKSQNQIIYLDGNPTTGYDWTYTIDNSEIASIDVQTKYLGAKGVVGAPSKYTVTFTSLKEGSTVAKFEYKRAWENNPPASYKEYNINVQSNGNISVELVKETEE